MKLIKIIHSVADNRSYIVMFSTFDGQCLGQADIYDLYERCVSSDVVVKGISRIRGPGLVIYNEISRPSSYMFYNNVVVTERAHRVLINMSDAMHVVARLRDVDYIFNINTIICKWQSHFTNLEKSSKIVRKYLIRLGIDEAVIETIFEK